MIWECSEGQWRGIDSIRPWPVSLLGWEIDLGGAGQGVLRGPTYSLVESGTVSNASQASLSKKVTWVRALIIDPQPRKLRRERFGGPPKGRWGKDRGDVERKTACTLRKGQKRWKNWGKETGVLRSEERSEFMGFGPAGEFKSTRWEANETHPKSWRMCRSGRPHYRICRHLHACCRAPSTF